MRPDGSVSAPCRSAQHDREPHPHSWRVPRFWRSVRTAVRERVEVLMADNRKTERVALFMSKAELSAIDEWAWQHRVRSLSEAIRILCAHGMTVETCKMKQDRARSEAGEA